MKRVLCFGDSNVYGCNTEPCSRGLPMARFDENTRWTSLLQKRLGSDYRVIEAGLNGRTTVFDDPTDYGKSGYAALDVIFKTNDPIDLFVIMLGTNDLRDLFAGDAFYIFQGMQRILVRLKELSVASLNPDMQILLLAPPHINMRPEYFMQYKPEWIEEGRKLPGFYRALSQMFGCRFADTSQWTEPGEVDGIHLDPAGHKIFAEKMEALVRSILEA